MIRLCFALILAALLVPVMGAPGGAAAGSSAKPAYDRSAISPARASNPKPVDETSRNSRRVLGNATEPGQPQSERVRYLIIAVRQLHTVHPRQLAGINVPVGRTS